MKWLKFGERKPRSAAAFSAHGIEQLDYANSRARVNPVRNFTQSIPLLSPEEMERAYLGSGLIWKGVNKKARDAFRKGFRIVPDDQDREDEAELNAQAREWLREMGYFSKAIQALREMFVFGDGFLELAYPDGANSFSPAPNRAPAAVYNVDPFSLLPVRSPQTGAIMAYLAPADDKTNVRRLDRNDVRKWAAAPKSNPLPKGVKAIHPSRIQHFQANALRQNPDGLGISVIQAAYVNALAKLAGDLAAGDVLEWYSKGFFVVNVEYGTQEELEETRKALDAAKQARKNYFVGSERSKFDIKSPTVASIKQFYDVFYADIAGALEMPQMALSGVQTGTVTGSETDLSQYYDDIHGFQTLHLEKPLLDMIRRVLGRTDISLDFAPLYVNKQTEADIAMKRSQATAGLFGAGVLSRRESIRFMATGELPNPETVPDEYGDFREVVEIAPTEESGASVPPDEPAPPEAVPMTDEDRAQIEAIRKLGLEIMREQDDLEE